MMVRYIVRVGSEIPPMLWNFYRTSFAWTVFFFGGNPYFLGLGEYSKRNSLQKSFIYTVNGKKSHASLIGHLSGNPILYMILTCFPLVPPPFFRPEKTPPPRVFSHNFTPWKNPKDMARLRNELNLSEPGTEGKNVNVM